MVTLVMLVTLKNLPPARLRNLRTHGRPNAASRGAPSWPSGHGRRGAARHPGAAPSEPIARRLLAHKLEILPLLRRNHVAERAHDLLDQVIADVSQGDRIPGRFFSRSVVVFEHPGGGIGIMNCTEFLTAEQVEFIKDVSLQAVPVPRPGGDA